MPRLKPKANPDYALIPPASPFTISACLLNLHTPHHDLNKHLRISRVSSYEHKWVNLNKRRGYHPFNREMLNKLIPGKSTAAEVTDLLGAPSKIVKLSNGNAYSYRRSLSKGIGLWLVFVTFGNYDKHYDQIVIFFDQKNVMTHYGVTLDAHKAAYGLPF
jgi:outer membrane protein assembly factor BamE (lipoprotein component of BamABCDE complex)